MPKESEGTVPKRSERIRQLSAKGGASKNPDFVYDDKQLDLECGLRPRSSSVGSVSAKSVNKAKFVEKQNKLHQQRINLLFKDKLDKAGSNTTRQDDGFVKPCLPKGLNLTSCVNKIKDRTERSLEWYYGDHKGKPLDKQLEESITIKGATAAVATPTAHIITSGQIDTEGVIALPADHRRSKDPGDDFLYKYGSDYDSLTQSSQTVFNSGDSEGSEGSY